MSTNVAATGRQCSWQTQQDITRMVLPARRHHAWAKNKQSRTFLRPGVARRKHGLLENICLWGPGVGARCL
eukprot:3335179-Lingulodinium_polyedra.AAC.1